MIRKRNFALCILAATTFAVASGVSAQGTGRSLEIEITSGPEWSHTKWFGIVRVTLLPQIALWLEAEDGSYVGELFVTRKAGQSTWGNARRPEALPVWSHARGIRYADGLYMPTKSEPLPDAVSGATPKGGKPIIITAALPVGIKTGSYRIFAEFNNSFDYNDVYREKLPQDNPHYNGVNGQPSVVYSGLIQIGPNSLATPLHLDYAGTGHPTGADGSITAGQEGLTTALQIVAGVTVRVR